MAPVIGGTLFLSCHEITVGLVDIHWIQMLEAGETGHSRSRYVTLRRPTYLEESTKFSFPLSGSTLCSMDPLTYETKMTDKLLWIPPVHHMLAQISSFVHFSRLKAWKARTFRLITVMMGAYKHIVCTYPYDFQ